MSVIITARRKSVLVIEEMAACGQADQLFGIIEHGHPDCEIVMKATTGAILLSVGPKRSVICPVMRGSAITGA